MCADLVNLERDIHILEENGVDYLHVDIMDAAFVPNLTFGPDVVNSIRKITSLPVDIHLLMEHPRTIIRSMDIRDGDIVSIHSECKESVLENAAFIKHLFTFGCTLFPIPPIPFLPTLNSVDSGSVLLCYIFVLHTSHVVLFCSLIILHYLTSSLPNGTFLTSYHNYKAGFQRICTNLGHEKREVVFPLFSKYFNV